MAERRLGCYRLVRRLGEGAMGTVWLAEQGDGRRVALKIFRPDLVERRGFLSRVQREAAAGREIEHENVVLTLDCDLALEDGLPRLFLVMEYVEGRTLRALLDEVGPLSEPFLREVGAQVAAGLAAIHAHRLVHRDLKPENLLVTPDDRVRIVDLGIAKSVATEASQRERDLFAGSSHYASPEQFDGREVGPAADLYSLGVTLHVLATGRNPFRRETPEAVERAHREEIPPRVTEARPDLSPFLAEVVAVLLAKRPKDRFPSAAAVHEALSEGERSAWWRAREPIAGGRAGAIPEVPVRRDAAIRGRDAELEAVRTAWAEAVAGRGGVLVVEGEAGIGKSRLVQEALARLDPPPVHALYGAFGPAGGLSPVAGAIAGRFGRTALLERLSPLLSRPGASAAALAAWIAPGPAAAGPEGPSVESIAGAVSDLAHGMAASGPTVWIVEDLHFAPAETEPLLRALAARARRSALLLILTTRPGPGVASTIGPARRLALSRLSPRDVVGLLEETLHSPSLADRLAGKVARQTDGVPLFVLEAIRALKEEHALDERPDGTWTAAHEVEEIAVPGTVRTLVEARLGDLARAEREILDVGAVEGPEFDAALVAEVLERPRVGVLQTLAFLERRTGLVHGAPRGFRFDHPLVREALEASLPGDLRAEYHARLADAFARRFGGGSDASGEGAAFAAWHHLHGNRPEAARAYVRPALKHWNRSYSATEAATVAERALSLDGFPSPEDRAFVATHLLQRLVSLGRMEDVGRWSARLLAEADATDLPLLRAAALAGEASLLRRDAKPAEAMAKLEEAERLARAAGDRPREAAMAYAKARCLWEVGRYDEALVAIDAARAIGATSDPEFALNLRVARAVVMDMAGRLDEAMAAYEEGAREAQALGRGRTHLYCVSNLALARCRAGRFEEAEAELAPCLAGAGDFGDRSAEANAIAAYGWTLAALGRFAEAIERLEAAVGLFEATESRIQESTNRSALAEAHRWLGRLDLSRESALRALKTADQIGSAMPRSQAHQCLGRTAEDEGREEEAERRYREALAIAAAGSVRPAEARARFLLSRWLQRSGRVEEARREADAAVEVASTTRVTGLALVAGAHRAHLFGDLTPERRRELLAREALVGVGDRIEARLSLWRAGGNPGDLAEARRLVERVLAQAPAEDRPSMREAVRVIREVLAESSVSARG